MKCSCGNKNYKKKNNCKNNCNIMPLQESNYNCCKETPSCDVDGFKNQAMHLSKQANCAKQEALNLEQQANELEEQIKCLYSQANNFWIQYNQLSEEANIYMQKANNCCFSESNVNDYYNYNNTSNCNCNKPIISCKKSGCDCCSHSN